MANRPCYLPRILCCCTVPALCALLSVSLPALATADDSGLVIAPDGWRLSAGISGHISYEQSLDFEFNSAADQQRDSLDHTGWLPNLSLRIGYWQQDRSWEVEYLRHAFSLGPSQQTPDVEDVDFSQGFDHLLFNRALSYPGGWISRFGLGAVLASYTIDATGTRSTDEYRLSGIASQLALERSIPLAGPLALSFEARLVNSISRLPLADGKLEMVGTALHLVAGLHLD